eukprot:symbB.v1.2.034854.t1/scaffold4571.1/size37810/2
MLSHAISTRFQLQFGRVKTLKAFGFQHAPRVKPLRRIVFLRISLDLSRRPRGEKCLPEQRSHSPFATGSVETRIERRELPWL